MLELLSPAGSMEALIAAVQNGANAVYLGCGAFNARQGAKNFTVQSLGEAVKYCHVRGVAVHLTLNTLVSDKETDGVCDLIRQAAVCGVDAFIVQDLGVVQMCRKIAPNIPVHGSTQMTVHSLSGVMLCALMGCSRVVLSRELDRDQIRYITERSPIEIEVFAHGALCMCYSGQCYLSAAIGGRSGNRGRCAQPCRQSYGYSRWENRYPLSLKDNCLVHNLQELERMGVASIKLEGRMKRPEYVAAVTRVYRKALDEGHVSREMMQDLMTAFNRQGFTDGYFTASLGREMFGVRQEQKDNPEWLKQQRQSYEAVENSLVPVVFRAVMDRDGSRLTVTDPEGRQCSVEGPLPETAQKVPMTQDLLAARLAKTGGTPYRCSRVDVDMMPGLTLPAAAINAMRRDVLDQLTALRGRRDVPMLNKYKKQTPVRGFHGRPALTVQVTNLEQITTKMLQLKPDQLYVPLHLLAQDLKLCRELTRRASVVAVLPRISNEEQLGRIRSQARSVREQGVRAVLVGNLGQLQPMRELGMRLHGDFGLNIYNSGAMKMAKDLDLASVMLSFEMTLPQIRDVSKDVLCEAFIYGRMPLMVTENCLIKGRSGSCTCQNSGVKLTDKTGADFPVIRDGDTCHSVLLNGKKLYWLDRQNDFAKLGLWATRMYFTTENPKEVDYILSCYADPVAFDPGAYTRGLYLRGLD